MVAARLMQARLWYLLQWLLWVCQADAVRVNTLVPRLSSVLIMLAVPQHCMGYTWKQKGFRVWRMQVTVGKKQR